jgi:GTP cyclohydrolase I
MARSPAKTRKPSRHEAEAAVRTLIEWIGEDPAREGLAETPARVVRAFEEYYAGYAQSPEKVLARTFREGDYKDPVVIRNIDFESRCEHHLAPFIGRAHIAYIPQGRIVGLSKVARLVDVFARRLQTQERLTAQIAQALQKHLKTRGVAVMLEAEHFCMKVRGARQKNACTVTTRFSGAYLKDESLRTAFLLQAQGL